MTELRKNPLVNFHSARIRSPKGFKDYGYTKNQFGRGIDAIYGLKEGRYGQKALLQSIRFDKRLYSAKEAEKWLRKKEIKPIKFEPARRENSPNGSLPSVNTASRYFHEPLSGSFSYF